MKVVRRIAAVLLFLLALVPTVLLGARVLSRLAGDGVPTERELERYESICRENSPYLRRVPMEELTNSQSGNSIFAYFRTDNTKKFPVSPGDTVRAASFVLPAALHYYTSPKDRIPALVLEKGTSVLLEPVESPFTYTIGYGTDTLPTYEEGWRYVRPFVEGTEMEPEKVGETVWEQPFYYIRIEEIEAVVLSEKQARSVPGLLWDEMGKVADTTGMRLFQISPGYVTWRLARSVDLQLLSKGLYLSPDLDYPLLDRLNVLCLLLSAVLIAGGILLWRGRIHRKER